MRKMRKTIIAVLVGTFAAVMATAAQAQEQIKDLTAQGAQVYSAGPGQSLSLPSQAAPAAVVANFLRAQGFSGETVCAKRAAGRKQVNTMQEQLPDAASSHRDVFSSPVRTERPGEAREPVGYILTIDGLSFVNNQLSIKDG